MSGVGETVSGEILLTVLQQHEKPSNAERQLARHLGLQLVPRSTRASSGAAYVLEINRSGLCLRGLEKGVSGVLRVDFAAGRLQRRGQQSLRRQLLGKAVGLNKQSAIRVLDATAGLGTDGYLLAAAGCKVRMLERSPVVFALLEDGLHRARWEGARAGPVTANIELRQQDFLSYPVDGEKFEVVYLDPMFASRRKSARARKPMYFLQRLLAAPDESLLLLNHARKLATRRVVFKRPRLAALTGGLRPDIQFRGRNSRFDVYLTQRMQDA